MLPARVAPYAKHLIEKVPPDLSRFLIAPMPGLLVRLDVGAGDTVEAGQALAVVEAMKMENPVTAHKDGTITGLAVEVGAAITQGTVLAEIK